MRNSVSETSMKDRLGGAGLWSVGSNDRLSHLGRWIRGSPSLLSVLQFPSLVILLQKSSSISMR